MEKVILLTSRCNQRCLFCFRLFDCPDRPVDELKEDLEKNAEEGIRNIVFSGGEPTLHADLEEACAHAASLGIFNKIALQTNAVKCADKGYAERIGAAGVNRILIPFHSHLEHVADFLTQAKGTWKKTVRGIENINETGIPISLNIVVNSYNYLHLLDYVEFIAAEMPFITTLTISVANPDGAARLNPWIVPRYEDIGATIVRAHKLCSERGIPSFNPDCGMPLCFLPGVEEVSSDFARAVMGDTGEKELELIRETSDAFKAKSPACAPCEKFSICPGVWKEYARIHGLDELKPIAEKRQGGAAEARPGGRESGEPGKTLKLRITGKCNNNCVFCSDPAGESAVTEGRAEVEAALRAGRADGADTVVFTGGEPTIHPDFLHFVAFAKKEGYGQVRVSTNGRMFSYADFCNKAAAAGLDYAAVSLHADRPEVHESITGAPGSFAQSVKGASNLVGTLGPENVKLRVVMCNENIGELHAFMHGLREIGAGEMELRGQVPFGRAFDGARAPSQPPPEGVARAVSAVIDINVDFRPRGLPPESMEGREREISSPVRLFGDAEKRLAGHFEYILKTGKIDCEGPRCGFCHMQPFCVTLKKYISAVAGCAFDSIEADCVDDSATIIKSAGLCSGGRLVLRADTPERTSKILKETAGSFREIVLEIPADKDPGGYLGGINLPDQVKRIIIRRPVPVGLLAERPEITFEIKINRHTTPWILGNFESFDGIENVELSIDSFPSLKETLANTPSLALLLKHLPPGPRFIGVPECITGQPFAPPDFSLPLRILDGGGNLILEKFVEHYMLRHCTTKSLRCRRCPRDAACPGIHVNYIRVMGYGELAVTHVE